MNTCLEADEEMLPADEEMWLASCCNYPSRPLIL